ncbi:MAG: DUF3568 family protein [Desulfobacterales bacterium]|nr:MAG: DUF3568 family protein [Desulfobacterales bacterium]
MKQKLFIFLNLAACTLIVACIPVAIGVGTGASTFAYIDGELKRNYPARYDEIFQVCTGLMQDLNLPINAKTTDGIQTTIQTERPDGTPMTIKVAILELNLTEVAVRTGAVGLWKKDVSEQFHGLIEDRLKKRKSKL